MTCDRYVLDTTCLGGFTQTSKANKTKDKANLYRGGGPGSMRLKENIPINVHCTPGSSHGGKASKGTITHDNIVVGPEYDKENLASLHGGSAGSCIYVQGSVAGGGAIELVSEKKSISINASIIASAQSSASAPCSGGSGGLIRLRAQKVEIHSNGRLIVDGGNRQPSAHPPPFLGGGAGGIIQIIAPKGYLSAGSLSLQHGTGSYDECQPLNDTNAYGYFYLPGDNRTGKYKTFPETLINLNGNPSSVISTSSAVRQSNGVTPSPSKSRSQPTVSPTLSSGLTDTQKLIDKLKLIRDNLQNLTEYVKSDIRDAISEHKNLTSNQYTSQQTLDLCLETFKLYQDIMPYIAQRDPEFAKDVLTRIFEPASDCIEDKNHAFWRANEKMPELLQTLEDISVASVLNVSSEVNHTVETSNTVIQLVRESPTKHMSDVKVPDFSAIKGDFWKKAANSLVIPKRTVMKAEGYYTYIFMLFKDVENALPTETTAKPGNVSSGDWQVSSVVMSCVLFLDEIPVKNLSPPAILTFSITAAEAREKQCSFWDNNEREWSPEGIEEINSSSFESIVCETNHFTSFAVLIKHKDTQISKKDRLALSIITYVGCGVSTVAFIITLIVFLSIESLSADRHKIHTNLVVSLLLAQVLFLAGIKETSNKVICKTIAVFLHYFFLTAFTWMLVEGLHLYLKVVQVFKTENVKILYYYIFGWGFAIIPVGITTAMKSNHYGNNEICWLSLEDGTVWAFIGPVIGIILVNCFILFMVIKTVVVSASSVKNDKHDHIKAGVKGLFVLMPILGVGWILGLFALNKGTVVFEYAFAIVNGFQGLLIFLLHCVFNNEVRQAFRRHREKNALSKENDSQYHASFSLSQSTDSGGKKRPLSHESQEKVKASVSFKKKKSPKLVQVMPCSKDPDISDNSLLVNRTFESGSSNNLLATDAAKAEISSLHCPISEDKERTPPKITHLVSQRTSTKRKHNRP
ncbi:adhesion G protein-coupled receptor L4-like isoform X3 [Montipora capricornis]